MMPNWFGLRKEAWLVFVRVIQAYPSVSVEQALVRVQIAAGWRMIVEQVTTWRMNWSWPKYAALT